MANRQPGYIDGRRARVGGVPIWGPVPSVLTPGSMEAYGIFDDFLSCEDLDADGPFPTGQATWEFLEATIGTIEQADEVGGAFIIASPAVINNGGQIILGSDAGGGAFVPAAGKHIWFEARAKVTINTAASFNHFIGLIKPPSPNADILENAGAAPTNNDIIGFIVLHGETSWSSIGDDGGDQTIATLTKTVDNDYHYFGFYVNGITDVTIYYDRAEVGAGLIAATRIPDGTGLMPAFAVKAGAAAGLDSLTVDYVMCVQLR